MPMRLTTYAIAALVYFGAALPFAGDLSADDPEYLRAVSDLPLAPGLVEDVDAGLKFDKPEGRIIEALARGALAKSDVTAFYRAALPGLGWKPLADDQSGSRWRRGEETLRVEIIDAGRPLVVRFSIAPN